MTNYKDGEDYWMKPRYAVLPWWEPIEDIEMPLVKEATEEESVYEPPTDDDPDTEATLAPSGMTLQPSGKVTGSFQEPADVAVEEDVSEPVLPPPETVEPELDEDENKEDEAENLGFPSSGSPSAKWRKIELLAFIHHKGGVANRSMKKDLLLTVALSLA